MSIWKQLSQQGVWKSLDQHDVYISTYVAKKRFELTGLNLVNNGIAFVPYGEAPAVPTSPTPSPTPSTSPTPSVTPSPSLTPSISPTPSVTPSKSPS